MAGRAGALPSRAWGHQVTELPRGDPPNLPGPHDPARLSPAAREALEGEAAAYALDALPAVEAAAYEAHLARCAFCRRLADEFVDIAGFLPAAPAAATTGSLGDVPDPEAARPYAQFAPRVDATDPAL